MTTLKNRGIWLLVVVLAVGLLYGCTARSTATKGGRTSQKETSTALREQVDYAALAGDYVFAAEGVDPRNYPTLSLREDQTCCFTVNLLTHMGHMEGSYTVQGSSLEIIVDEVDFDGFIGDDVRELRFDLGGEGIMLYRGSASDEEQVIGMTNPYDIFKRQA